MIQVSSGLPHIYEDRWQSPRLGLMENEGNPANICLLEFIKLFVHNEKYIMSGDSCSQFKLIIYSGYSVKDQGLF